MSSAHRKFSRDFKIKVVEAYQSGVSAAELSRQFEIHPNVIYTWTREYRTDPVNAFPTEKNVGDSPKADDQRIGELGRMVRRLALEDELDRKSVV